jgi:hypothetical protein
MNFIETGSLQSLGSYNIFIVENSSDSNKVIFKFLSENVDKSKLAINGASLTAIHKYKVNNYENKFYYISR